MNDNTILQAVQWACQNPYLQIQVTRQDSYWLVCLNYPQEHGLDRSSLIANISTALGRYCRTPFGVWLYTRPLGHTDADWVQYLEIIPAPGPPLPTRPRATETIRSNTAITSASRRRKSTSIPPSSTAQAASPEVVSQPKRTVIRSSSNSQSPEKTTQSKSGVHRATAASSRSIPQQISDTASDFSRSSSAKVAPPNSPKHKTSQPSPSTRNTKSYSKPSASEKKTVSENKVPDWISPPPGVGPTPPPKPLNEYCFIRNKSLLKSKLKPPSKVIAQKIQQFHNMEEAEQLQVIAPLEKVLQSGIVCGETLAPELQNWLRTVADLADRDVRTAAIWFSRYCQAPEATIGTIEGTLKLASSVASSRSPGSASSRPHSQR